MIDRTARESCDTSYHEARSVASDEAEQDQHSEPSAAHDGSVASETPYNAEWLSELIGTASVLLKSSSFLLGHLGVNPRKVHAGHLCASRSLMEPGASQSFRKGCLGSATRSTAKVITTMDAFHQADKVYSKPAAGRCAFVDVNLEALTLHILQVCAGAFSPCHHECLKFQRQQA